jgi:hypothetical protein
MRRHLRLFTLTWLVCQVLSLSAFVPSDCCAAHRGTAAAGQECHGDADGLCPMRAVTGEECPMHASGSASSAPCVMRGLCNGPAVALSALLSVPGVLARQVQAQAIETSSSMWSEPDRAFDVVVPHDTPPPRL